MAEYDAVWAQGLNIFQKQEIIDLLINSIVFFLTVYT